LILASSFESITGVSGFCLVSGLDLGGAAIGWGRLLNSGALREKTSNISLLILPGISFLFFGSLPQMVTSLS
jgi:hypothetical protein